MRLRVDDVPVVIGDPSRLRQVLDNLLANVRTHTPPGDSVFAHASAATGDDAVVIVADEGPGMPDDDAARAFDRFHRADTSRTRASGGAGLGLSIVAAIVAAHHGSVAMSSSPGVGTTVTVRLPIVEGDAVNDVMWYLSRSTGIVAAVLAVAALAWGFLFSARETGTRYRPAWWLDLHNWLGGIALIFTIAHIATSYLNSDAGLSLASLFVPGVAPSQRLALAWGVIATYLIATTVLTSWPRKLFSRTNLAHRAPRIRGRCRTRLRARLPDGHRRDPDEHSESACCCSSQSAPTRCSSGWSGCSPTAEPPLEHVEIHRWHTATLHLGPNLRQAQWTHGITVPDRTSAPAGACVRPGGATGALSARPDRELRRPRLRAEACSHPRNATR